MIIFTLLKSRFSNKLQVVASFLMLVTAFIALIFCVCNIYDSSKEFNRNGENTISITLSSPVSVAKICEDIKGYGEKEKITFIDFVLDADMGLYHRKNLRNDFLHNFRLDDSKYQIILSSEYKSKYFYGDKFTFNDIEYDIINFSESGASYCSAKGLENFTVTHIFVEMTDLRDKAAKDNAKAQYSKIFENAKYSFSDGSAIEFLGRGLQNAYSIFFLLCFIIILVFPFLENLEQERRAYKISGYTAVRFVAISLIYQLLLFVVAFAIGLIVNVSIAPQISMLYLPKIIFLALTLAIVNSVSTILRLLIKRRKTI